MHVAEVTMEGSKDLSRQAIERPFKVVHALQDKWVLWHLNGDRKINWEDRLKKVNTIGSVEEFWSIYLKLAPASTLQSGSDYYMFKEGIKPCWEDPKNKNGGRWVYVFEKRERFVIFDDQWLTLMLLLICDSFGAPGNIICGGAANVRAKGDKVALWTSSDTCETVNRAVALAFAKQLGLANEKVHYELHKDATYRFNSNLPAAKFTAVSSYPVKFKRNDYQATGR